MALELKFVYLKEKGTNIEGTSFSLPKGAIYAVLYEEGDTEKVYRYFYVINAKVMDEGKDFIIFETKGKEIDDVISVLNSKYEILKNRFVKAYRKANKANEINHFQNRKTNSPTQMNKKAKRDIIMEITIEHMVSGRKEKYCIAQNKDVTNVETHVYHYTSLEARELITAVFVPGRERIGYINKNMIRVEKVIFMTDNGSLPEDMKPQKLILQRNGGLYISNLLKQGEIIDLLLYSPYTGRYEIIKATRNDEADYCFTDVRLFREFVDKFGNPGLEVEFRAMLADTGMYMDLQEKSILNEFGYNVSTLDDLSTKSRQDILTEIIDLNILRQDEILRYLNFFIASHKGDKYNNARAKWKADYNFVLHYRQNAERFMIAQNGLE